MISAQYNITSSTPALMKWSTVCNGTHAAVLSILAWQTPAAWCTVHRHTLRRALSPLIVNGNSLITSARYTLWANGPTCSGTPYYGFAFDLPSDNGGCLVARNINPNANATNQAYPIGLTQLLTIYCAANHSRRNRRTVITTYLAALLPALSSVLSLFPWSSSLRSSIGIVIVVATQHQLYRRQQQSAITSSFHFSMRRAYIPPLLIIRSSRADFTLSGNATCSL